MSQNQDTTTTKTEDVYDTEVNRGAPAPAYTPEEARYRHRILDSLQLDYIMREQSHMELNDMTYSEYYLINRQQDMAYNPPRKNAADSRIVSGITHEKDNTILSIIDDMNFQPKVCIYDEDDEELTDAAAILTARLKKSLKEDNFKEKQSDFTRVNISQGNVFIEEKPYLKQFQTTKIPIGQTTDPTKMKWKTIVKKQDVGCSSQLIPNTAVFMPNLLEKNMHKQDHVWVVLHVPRVLVAQYFKKFPRWKNVPLYPTRFIPQNVTGIWGDYYLQQPQKDYVEFSMYQSECRNEYNILLNGVMMYAPGFPLTHFSPSGKYTIVKGDNEPIPFFSYGKSVPSKTEVKEETQDELMRLMVFKMRQAAKPPVGNNSEKVLPANIWDPGIVTPDITAEELSVLTPNAGITDADFKFYELIVNSISDSSVSDTLEGQNDTGNITLGQFADQKKESLRKLGISLDNTIAWLKEVWWLRLINDAQYLTQKTQKYDKETGELIEAYGDFMVDETGTDGLRSKTQVKFVDDNTNRSGLEGSQSVLDEEEGSGTRVKKFYVRPEYLQELVNKMKDKMYIEVVSEPEGNNRNLLAVLFNLMTQYANLRGGTIPNINYDYLDKLIGQSSGFEWDKIFTKAQPAPMTPMNPDGTPTIGLDGKPMVPNTPIAPGKASAPVLPQNPVLNKGFI